MKRLTTLCLALLLGAFAAVANDAPLADASEKSDRTAIRTLLKQRADVNAAHADGMTALHWATYRDDFETAKALVQAKAEVALTNHYGVTPLSLACQNGSTAIVQLLLAHGADANTTLRGGETVLMTAARTGKPGAVEALLKRKADVNANTLRADGADVGRGGGKIRGGRDVDPGWRGCPGDVAGLRLHAAVFRDARGTFGCERC